ncbi:AGC/DMPK protein kinase [Fusarium oxysporum f. sp. lycopersici 4287]|uniref:EKC/KEOPS complex subunit BUD32 n=1 Tax=Fusarium oxysporum f. sp. lycopersici (strain 4287 / CBS 123668 / FGSC 9935 / NRRL 34936) TaxID=426428 RepID=A0A0J9V5Q7_FUSO4|nr:AGC/DMPK protein kinase [Fusarium oxysporum f. sp. lycopersici 4287]KAJ9419404.1 AGC/DMPK protein kinase [Fusarium oxysporum]KNB06503.1 AGC/DMPK protein kinase [Fusarium oxysporum f. sp. lycopersici 4287]WKT54235.1 Protein kinase domain [Fusarium oxysporum f. sp. vasinfectum]
MCLIPPPQLSKFPFVSLGATAWIFRIDEFTVVKFARTTGSSDFVRENAFFDELKHHAPSPHVIQSFYRTQDAIFLPFLAGGSLENRLRNNQIRDSGKFVRVKRIEPVELLKAWTMELTAGSAWIESLGYVHGDLRPGNLLLDAEDHLKLTDFGWANKIGTPASGNGAPWARLLGPETGADEGTWGLNGPQTEQFAIGSIVYCMTRGREPFEGEIEDGRTQVEMFQNMNFPELHHDQLDYIIRKCWHGEFGSLQELAIAAKTIHSIRPTATALSVAICRERKEVCQRLVGEGLLSSDI